ncbi:mucin-like protein 3 isoform X2 [Nannospalax galili]|uniref:mucin-like protein 3 isoform X2 n=1 Tax=Nannospalax galili TaxID=1026970 RepID=UPI00111C4CD2|nr:mucin-like protein 3 isoform X2 [Nannospalax galili]XP_029422889.1 mucin-like protein 3 isoform X2 [Nannospalax galili]
MLESVTMCESGVWSWLTPEAQEGVTTVHELQKTSESSTSAHLPSLAPGLIHRTPSGHADLNSGQQLPDLPKSVATPKPKRHCNTTHRAKPVHSVDNSKATVHNEMTPATEWNTSSQRNDPMIRNGRAADDANATDRSHPTSAPRGKTTCKSTTGKTRVTRNSATADRPMESTVTMLGTSSPKATVPSHDSEINRKNTSSSVKPTDAPRTTYQPSRTPATSKGTEDYRTPFSSEEPLHQTTKQVKETPSAGEYEGTVSTHEGTTRAHPMSTESEGETTLANEKMTQVSEKSTEHPEETTAHTENATRVSQTPTVFQRKTTLGTKTTKSTEKPEKTGADLKTMSPPVKVTGGKRTTCHLNKTKTTRRGPTGSLTSRMDLRSNTSGAPGDTSHTQQNTHSPHGGLLASGVIGESNSFPAWAIVIVVLVAVILLLIFIGLIFLVSCASRSRRAIAHNDNDPEDNDPEDRGGRNSYPVYLMEQQNKNLNQTPYPR